jgi:hypothetical protein
MPSSESRLLALTLAPLIGLGSCAMAPQPPESAQELRCVGEAYANFDFWIGDRDIEQLILRQDGGWLTFPARKTVAASPDKSEIVEHWSGDVQIFWEHMEQPQNIWGFSVRRYDAAQRTWSIFWMDQRHPDFEAPYVGNFAGDRGEFFRKAETPEGPALNRISFERGDPQTVDWELSASADAGATWTPLWRMKMRRW